MSEALETIIGNHSKNNGLSLQLIIIIIFSVWYLFSKYFSHSAKRTEFAEFIPAAVGMAINNFTIIDSVQYTNH